MVGKHNNSAVKHHSSKDKNQRRKFNKKRIKAKLTHLRPRRQIKSYICTLCKEAATKIPCGTVKETPDGEVVRTGLGKWRCRTHGKCKVQVVTKIEQENKIA